jgi:hypothetical protein
VTTGSDVTKAAIAPATNTNPNPNLENLSTKEKAKTETAKPAIQVTTGWGVTARGAEAEELPPLQSRSACEEFREAIELGLSTALGLRAASND